MPFSSQKILFADEIRDGHASITSRAAVLHKIKTQFVTAVACALAQTDFSHTQAAGYKPSIVKRRESSSLNSKDLRSEDNSTSGGIAARQNHMQSNT